MKKFILICTMILFSAPVLVSAQEIQSKPLVPQDQQKRLDLMKSKGVEASLTILPVRLLGNPFDRVSEVLGLFLEEQGAIAECDKLLKIDPENIFAYMNKGCGYINMKQYAQGIEALNQGLKIDSTNAECLRFLGIAYMNLGDSLTASRYFEKEYRVLNK